MAIEIERKFLVTGNGWKNGSPKRLTQGYLNTDKSKTVRVRIADDKAFITIKGLLEGKEANLARSEYEYSIPTEDAEQLLLMCGDATLEKHRYVIPIGNFVWEVDEFFGMNEGLVVAEVELESEDQKIELPSWVGTEVSGDVRYFNSSLVSNPYKLWRNEV